MSRLPTKNATCKTLDQCDNFIVVDWWNQMSTEDDTILQSEIEHNLNIDAGSILPGDEGNLNDSIPTVSIVCHVFQERMELVSYYVWSIS